MKPAEHRAHKNFMFRKNIKSAILAFAALGLPMILALPGLAADFDQSQFEGVSPMLLARMTAEAAVLAPQSANTLGIELFHAHLGTYLMNNAAHAQMATFLRDSRMDHVSVDIRERLRAQGADLTAARNAMMPAAGNLDSEDTTLAAQRDQLNANKKRLDARLVDINQQVAQHNAACLPTHPPERHSWCVANANRLKGIVAHYNADVATHNSAVDKWKSSVAALQPRWDSFVQKIQAWESQVKNLIQKIQKAFELKDCEYKKGASEVIRLDPIESKIACEYDCCGLPSEYYHFISSKPTQEQVDFICKNPLPRCPGSSGFQ